MFNVSGLGWRLMSSGMKGFAPGVVSFSKRSKDPSATQVMLGLYRITLGKWKRKGRPLYWVIW